MKIMWAATVTALLVLPACTGKDRAERPRVSAQLAGWRTIATQADRDRLRNWRDAWTQGLARITSPVDRAGVAAEGMLLQPDAAQLQPAPPPGAYRCRVIKIGAKDAGGMNYVAARPSACRITLAGDVLTFAGTEGAQRPVGRLFADDGGRLVFLGTMIVGDETRALDYGQDSGRDMAGVLERIGPSRWRLVMPFPRWESTINVLELVPAG